MYSVTIIASWPGDGAGEEVALGGGIRNMPPRPRYELPGAGPAPRAPGNVGFPLGFQALGPLPCQVIWGPEPGGWGRAGWSGDAAEGALQGEAAVAWHLPRVTTPSRRMILGWSNWPMMDASLRKSRRCLSV